MPWGSDEEVERRNRIRLAVWAYAYEAHDDPIATDAEFDGLAATIRPEMSTGNPKLDRFFATEFSPITGMWVRAHPDRRGLHRIYLRLKALKGSK